jgi:hypothetical protein
VEKRRAADIGCISGSPILPMSFSALIWEGALSVSSLSEGVP